MMLLWPLRKVRPDLYWKIEGYLFHWLLAMVSLWCDSAGYRSKYDNHNAMLGFILVNFLMLSDINNYRL